MDDDFNTGGALGELFEIVHALNRMAGGLTQDNPPPERSPNTARAWWSSRS